MRIVAGLMDAEIVQHDGVNYARPICGLLPIYSFPSDSSDMSSDPMPAMQLHGVWFRVNPIASNSQSGSEIALNLKSENTTLKSEIETLRRQIEEMSMESRQESLRRDSELQLALENTKSKMSETEKSDKLLLEAENASLHVKVGELERELSDYLGGRKSVDTPSTPETFEMMKSEYARLLGENAVLQRKLEEAQREAQEARAEKMSESQANQQSASNVEILKSEIETLKRRLSQAQSRSRNNSSISSPSKPSINGHYHSNSPIIQQSPSDLTILSGPKPTPPAGITHNEYVVDITTVLKNSSSTPERTLEAH